VHVVGLGGGEVKPGRRLAGDRELPVTSIGTRELPVTARGTGANRQLAGGNRQTSGSRL